MRAWEVKPSPVALAGEVPLLFKDTNALPEKSVAQVNNALSPFVGWLDQERKSGDEDISNFSRKLNEAVFSQFPLPDRQLTSLANRTLFPSAFAFLISDLRNSVIFTYQFH